MPPGAGTDPAPYARREQAPQARWKQVPLASMTASTLTLYSTRSIQSEMFMQIVAILPKHVRNFSKTRDTTIRSSVVASAESLCQKSSNVATYVWPRLGLGSNPLLPRSARWGQVCTYDRPCSCTLFHAPDGNLLQHQAWSLSCGHEWWSRCPFVLEYVSGM